MVPQVKKYWKVIFVTSALFLLLSSHGYCSINDPFVVHPTNQTAPFGESVIFECVISSCDHTLTFLANGQSLEHLSSMNVSDIYYRERIECNEFDQQVAMLYVIINYKTLEEVEYVNCNLTLFEDGDFRVISSDKAYIDDDIKCPCQLPTEKLTVTDNSIVPEYSIDNPSSNIGHRGKLSILTMITSILLLISL